MAGCRPRTAPLCLSSDFYQHHRPERDPLIMGGISAHQPMCVVLRGFQPLWFLSSLWSLWPPRNSFQEHNNQISCYRLEPGRTKEVEGTPADPCLFIDPGRHPGVTLDKTTFQPHLIRLHPQRPTAPT